MCYYSDFYVKQYLLEKGTLNLLFLSYKLYSIREKNIIQVKSYEYKQKNVISPYKSQWKKLSIF